MLGTGFFLFGNNNASSDASKSEKMPTLKLITDREAYRPGDSVCVTVEILNPSDGVASSLLVERLGFEIRGIEKLDTQWFAAPKPLPGSRQRKGEYVFMDGSVSSITTNQIVSSGASKAYVVQTLLPNVIPPSYRGATIRYLYYVKSSLFGRQLILENGHSIRESTEDAIELEARIPLQIWVTQKSNGLEEGHNDGIVPASTIQLDMYWKEMDDDSEWIKANEMDDGVEEGYESSRDEILSVSSYNLSKENIHKSLRSSLSLQSTMARSSYKDITSLERGRSSVSSALAAPRLSAAEIMTVPSADIVSTANSSVIDSASQQQKTKFKDDAEESSVAGAGTSDITASEGCIRGRSYNIRANNQVLLRYSPKNSDSTYYFSDMIGGTLTFFHGEGDRRCLEVSVSLETSETISQTFVHPSRKNSPTITKVQNDHHEVVADLVQTSFQFSIPMDGPMSFSTPRVSVQWALRFEFLMTPENVDWRRYEHPLLVEARDKCEWLLPIVVHAPPPRAAATKEKPFSMDVFYHT